MQVCPICLCAIGLSAPVLCSRVLSSRLVGCCISIVLDGQGHALSGKNHPAHSFYREDLGTSAFLEQLTFSLQSTVSTGTVST